MKLAAILLLCLSQSACLAVAAVGAVTDVTIAVITVPIKVGAAVIDAVTDDEDDKEDD
ncbi:MAG: hypothetical protein ACI9WS_002036 [Paraglaciecola psychrophila]|jgi:hypothetical protein